MSFDVIPCFAGYTPCNKVDQPRALTVYGPRSQCRHTYACDMSESKAGDCAAMSASVRHPSTPINKTFRTVLTPFLWSFIDFTAIGFCTFLHAVVNSKATSTNVIVLFNRCIFLYLLKLYIYQISFYVRFFLFVIYDVKIKTIVCFFISKNNI